MANNTIAHYEITAKLGRDVTLKVMPEQFACYPQRMNHFSGEARALTSLNHPGVASIRGSENQDGVRALMLLMELGEGPGTTLST